MRFLIFIIIILSSTQCIAKEIPEKWKKIGLLTETLVHIDKETDENGFYADYHKLSNKALWEKVELALKQSGYNKTGSILDGLVIGFMKGDDKIAAKIEQTGDILHLSIFNDKGRGGASLLHGLLFKNHTLEKIFSKKSGETIILDE